MSVTNQRCLTFSSSTELVRVSPHALVYAVADGNYTVVHFMDGSKYVLSLQLGQMEERLSSILHTDDQHFVRVGKSLIINIDHASYINFVRKRLVLSDAHTFRHEISASREALKALKEYMERKEVTNE